MSLCRNRKIMSKQQESEKFEQYFCTVIGCIGALMIGTIQAWTSPSQQYLRHPIKNSAPFRIRYESEDDWIAAFAPFGSIFGALAGGLLANLFGRRGILSTSSVPWIGTWILTTFAPSVYLLCVARFIHGIIVGIFSTVLPLYINEIAEESIKGTLGTFFQFFVTVGILLVYILGAFHSYLVLNLTLTAVCAILFIGLYFIPESPNYLIMKNQELQAEKELRRLRGPNFDVSTEINGLLNVLGHKNKRKLSIALVCTRANITALVISAGLMVFQQFSGINAVIFFAESIFTEAGSSSPEFSAIILGVTQTIATGVSSVLVERAGRKILLLLSCFIMCICLLMLGYYFWEMDQDRDTLQITWLPLTSLVGYVVAYALGLGPLPWMMTGDLFMPDMQGLGATITATTNLVGLTLVTLYFETLADLISTAWTFWLFAIICALATLFTLVVIPETKGKTPEQVQNILG